MSRYENETAHIRAEDPSYEEARSVDRWRELGCERCGSIRSHVYRSGVGWPARLCAPCYRWTVSEADRDRL